MMETSKAQQRRAAEEAAGEFKWSEVFKGVGIDVGPENDPLPGAIPFQLRDGDSEDLRKFFGNQPLFDYIHGSQVIEHFRDPVLGLTSWIALVKPGGHIVATVPDFELFEKSTYPSRWNAGHRSIWAPYLHHVVKKGPIVCILPDWLRQFPVQILLCRLVTTNYNYALGPEVDQTFKAEDGVECFHEFVLKKL